MAELNSHDYDSVAHKAENSYYLAFFRKCLSTPGLGKLGFRLHGPDLQGGETYSVTSVQEVFYSTMICAAEEKCGVRESM